MMTEKNEFLELDSQTCGRIALHVYQQYKEAMKPPIFKVLSFEEWLKKVIDYHDRQSSNGLELPE